MSPLLHIFKELIRLCQRFGCWMRSRPTILLYSPASLYFPQVCFYRLGEFLTKLNPFLSVSSFAKHRYMHGMIMKQTRKRHKKWRKWHNSHDTPIRKDPQTPKNCFQVLLKTFFAHADAVCGCGCKETTSYQLLPAQISFVHCVVFPFCGQKDTWLNKTNKKLYCIICKPVVLPKQ